LAVWWEQGSIDPWSVLEKHEKQGGSHCHDHPSWLSARWSWTRGAQIYSGIEGHHPLLKKLVQRVRNLYPWMMLFLDDGLDDVLDDVLSLDDDPWMMVDYLRMPGMFYPGLIHVSLVLRCF
jgi:hypothetical protein